MAATSRNTETSQYLPHTIYHKNAAQQARRNPGDPHSHILQPKTSNIYANAAQQARRNEKSRRPTQQARGSTRMLRSRPGPRIYGNAAQQARRNEKSRRPTQQARGLATSQHICTSNFNNIFNPRLHASSAYLGLNIYSPVHIDNLNTPDNSEASKRPNGVISKRRMRSLLFLMPEWHSLFFARMA